MRAVVTVTDKTMVKVLNIPTKFYVLGIVKNRRTISRQFAAVTDVLGLAAYGNTPMKAQENLDLVIIDALYGAVRQGELTKMLLKYGWKRVPKHKAKIEQWELRSDG